MPALNFQQEFADAITHNDKRQTVRALRKDGRLPAKAGDTLKLYTGMRIKACRPLGEATVTRVASVEIHATGMKMNGEWLPTTITCRDDPTPTDTEFAVADGFSDFSEMADWFDDTHGLPFVGNVIQWRDFSAS